MKQNPNVALVDELKKVTGDQTILTHLFFFDFTACIRSFQIIRPSGMLS